MVIFFAVLSYLVSLYILVLFARLVFDWIQFFARSWRPSGVLLVVANVIYGLTDPPLRALRKLFPPIRLGAVSLDTSFIILFFGVSLLIWIINVFAGFMIRY